MTASHRSPDIVFLGPSLDYVTARRTAPQAVFLPPAACGDVLRSRRLRPRSIALVDGVFERVAAVWHKEILLAIEEGITVYGASSMGALRAAELAAFGMIGVGRVFRGFHEGEWTDDDEVAVLHGPPERGYPCLTDAMVNIRATVGAALARDVLDAESASRVIDCAKRAFYQERRLSDAVGRAREDGDKSRLDRFETFLRTGGYVDQKRLDALQLLRRLDSEPPGAPAAPAFRTHRSVFFRKLHKSVMCSPMRSLATARPEDARPRVEAVALQVDRKWGLEGRLLRRLGKMLAFCEALARRQGLEPGPADLAAVGDEGDFGLGPGSDSPEWDQLHDLQPAEKRALLERLARIRLLLRARPPRETPKWSHYLLSLLRLHGAYPSFRHPANGDLDAFCGGISDPRFGLFRRMAKLWRIIDAAALDAGIDPGGEEVSRLADEFRLARGLAEAADAEAWLSECRLDMEGFHWLVAAHARLAFLLDGNNFHALGWVDGVDPVFWLGDALLLTGYYQMCKEADGPPPKSRQKPARWTPGRALEETYRFIHDVLLPKTPDLFKRISDSIGGRPNAPPSDMPASEASALLLDANEHIFCAPLDTGRQEVLRSSSRGRVLDFGCGAGFFALDLALAGRSVTCIDTNRCKLDFIKWAAGRLGVEELVDFSPSGRYDTVVCINVIDHMEDASPLLAGFAEQLAPRGALFLYAHFTDDGVHTADPGAIGRAFETLAGRFWRPDLQPTGGLERWVALQPGQEGPVPKPPETAERLAVLYPRRHPDLRILERGEWTEVRGKRFYLRPASIDSDALSVLRLSDGTSSAARITERIKRPSLSREACFEVIRELADRRLVWLWKKPRPLETTS